MASPHLVHVTKCASDISNQYFQIPFDMYTSCHRENKRLLAVWIVHWQSPAQSSPLILSYLTWQWNNWGQCRCKRVWRSQLDVHNPASPFNGIGENTHLQSDAKPVTKALFWRRWYHPIFLYWGNRKQWYGSFSMISKRKDGYQYSHAMFHGCSWKDPA